MIVTFTGDITEVNTSSHPLENSFTVDKRGGGLVRVFRGVGPTTAELASLLGKQVKLTINVEEVSDETRTTSANGAGSNGQDH